MVGMMLENCEIKKTKLLEHVRPELSPALPSTELAVANACFLATSLPGVG